MFSRGSRFDGFSPTAHNKFSLGSNSLWFFSWNFFRNSVILSWFFGWFFWNYSVQWRAHWSSVKDIWRDLLWGIIRPVICWKGILWFGKSGERGTAFWLVEAWLLEAIRWLAESRLVRTSFWLVKANIARLLILVGFLVHPIVDAATVTVESIVFLYSLSTFKVFLMISFLIHKSRGTNSRVARVFLFGSVVALNENWCKNDAINASMT